MWSLVQIYEDDDEDSAATAEVIYQRIMQSFDYFRDIPRGNLIGFMSDGCKTMTGRWKGVCALFERDFPGILTLICPSHALHLCAKDAAEHLPKEVLEFPRDTYNFMKTPKRKFHLTQEQIDTDTDIQRLLQSVITRWLSAGPCIDRLIDQ